MVPSIRISEANNMPVNARGDFVLYWMTAFRRKNWNFSLQRAVEWAKELEKPLVILEALRCDYPWASDRLHTFILEGMRDNRRHFDETSVLYFPFVEARKGEGKGLLEKLGPYACVVIADDYPAFFLPRMVTAAARSLMVKLEVVDSNGLLPLRAMDQVFTTAFSFRRFLQKNLPEHLEQLPAEDPLAGVSLPPLATLPEAITVRWGPAAQGILNAFPECLNALPINHRVQTAPVQGGSEAARNTLRTFLKEKLHPYHMVRNHPDDDGASGLSPYLHFGHISVHQVVAELVEQEDWTPERLSIKATGKRVGWWGMSEGAEAFLDQLITWRELGFNMCFLRKDYDQFESLPGWVLKDLLDHAGDARPYRYSLAEFEAASTHDLLWNAAQTQLLQEGRMHNYLRMLWGKKILEWSPSPQDALAVMLELNNKYALDGRDPNSYTGIFWVLGRYDRPWFPQRPVFGKIRYMSSASTMRKVRVEEYLQHYSR
jgi:deoxyribodipyrimidine photo-lyase